MYTLKKNDIEISINESPLEIRSLKIGGKEICYQQDGSWKKNWPFLFPIVGRLKNEHMIYKGKTYNLPRHGFFRDIDDFKIDDESEGLVTFTAKSNGRFRDIYPFEFEIKHQIEICDHEVVLSYEVKNLENDKMIFTMGHHPAFILRPNGKVVFEKEESFTKKTDEKGLVVSKPKYELKIKEAKLTDLSFENGAFYFTQDVKSTWVRYVDDEVSFEIDLSDYGAFLLWSPSNEEKFICLEPWLGIPDPSDRVDSNFEEKPRMINLEKDENYVCELKIKFLTNK